MLKSTSLLVFLV